MAKKAILVVSFGTSVNATREKTIDRIEADIQKAMPDRAFYRAWTSGMIIRKIEKRDDVHINTVEEAMKQMLLDGITDVIVQPTHVIRGIEYDQLKEAVLERRSQFEQVQIGTPLLTTSEDTDEVLQAVMAEIGTIEKEEAVVFMGHGTSHTAKISYSQMQSQMTALGYENVFIGTVEGEPEDTSCENVIQAVKDAGYKKVILRPLMVVAGDHANNDMAGDDDDSWKSQFTASGNFDSIDTQIAGLGEIEAVQKLYVEHTKNAIESLGKVSKSASSSAVSALEDGTYTAKFNTDSGMFHVNEADNGCGTLTVKNGKMTIHIRLVSKKIINLFVGTAADAAKDGAKLLQPTNDTVKYSDGTTEEVYGFDVPVEALDKEFDLAILGTKGTWYDHKVSVSDAQKN